jgi:hypothetical protein
MDLRKNSNCGPNPPSKSIKLCTLQGQVSLSCSVQPCLPRSPCYPLNTITVRHNKVAMTEYTTSSQAIREYMTSRERTAYWVQSHTPNEIAFYSPSVPPSVIDGLVSSPPSEAESSRSVPPRMILRYGDGRPDIPIQPSEPIRSRSRRREDSSPTSPTTPHNPKYRQRSGSHGSSPLARSHHTSSRSDRSPPVPEEIRVLPSRPDNGPQPSSSSHQPRSKSLPRTADLRSRAEAAPPLPPPQIPSHGLAHAPHPPAWHPYSGRPPKQPPSIVYAPSHQTRTHYAPPAMLHYPPQMGPNGMIYSHSAPVNQSQFARGMTSAPYPHSAARPSHRENVWPGRGRDDVTNHDQMRSLSARRGAASSSSSSLSSAESGGTYYVLPHHGQKVHIIVSDDIPNGLFILTPFARPLAPSAPSGRQLPQRDHPPPRYSRNLSCNVSLASPSSLLWLHQKRPPLVADDDYTEGILQAVRRDPGLVSIKRNNTPVRRVARQETKSSCRRSPCSSILVFRHVAILCTRLWHASHAKLRFTYAISDFSNYFLHGLRGGLEDYVFLHHLPPAFGPYQNCIHTLHEKNDVLDRCSDRRI